MGQREQIEAMKAKIQQDAERKLRETDVLLEVADYIIGSPRYLHAGAYAAD